MNASFDPYHRWLGIPPAEQPPNLYRLLGLALYESDAQVISEAADRQMSFVQSQKSGPRSQESQTLLNELAAARLTLLNPARRAIYDSSLRAILAGKVAPVAVAAAPAAPPSTAPPPAFLALNPFTARSAPPTSDYDAYRSLESPTAQDDGNHSTSAYWPALITGVVVSLAIVLGIALFLVWSKTPPRATPTVQTIPAVSPKPSSETVSTSGSVEGTNEAKSTGGAFEPSGAAESPAESSIAESVAAPTGSLGGDLVPELRRRVRDWWVTTPLPSPPGSTLIATHSPAAVSERGSMRRNWPLDVEIEAARRQVQESFGSQINLNWSTEAKVALARSLLEKARVEKFDAKQFALLERGLQLAASARDQDLLWEFCGELEAAFYVDASAIRSQMLLKSVFSAKTPEAASLMAHRWIEMVDGAVAYDEFEQAAAWAEQAAQWIRRSDDESLKPRASRQLAELNECRAAFEVAKHARTTLREQRDDRAAAAEWGRYLVLYKQDFASGLPLLALGADPLAALAARNLNERATFDVHTTLPDVWWTATDAEKDSTPQKSLRMLAVAASRTVCGKPTPAEQKRLDIFAAAFEKEYPLFPLGEWCSGLDYVDLMRDARRDRWTRHGASVQNETDAGTLAVPIIPDGDYDLSVRFTRLTDVDTVLVAVPIGSGHVRACFSAWEGLGHALLDLDNQVLPGSRSRIEPGKISNNVEYLVDVSVSQNGDRGQIDVRLDGAKVLHWEGVSSSIRAPSGRDQETRCIRLETSRATASFRNVNLRLRSGKARFGVN